jgi:leucyl aminopeptidase
MTVDLKGLASSHQAAQERVLPLHAIRPDEVSDFLAGLDPVAAAFLKTQNFNAAAGTLLLLPGQEGISGAVLGLDQDASLYAFGALPYQLPPGSLWRLCAGGACHDNATLGFLLGAYAYDRLKAMERPPALLLAEHVSASVIATAEAICFARDLINTPANLLGPAELADAAMALAERFGAKAERINGDVLSARYPALHAVGIGSDRAPEAISFAWQSAKATDSAPLVSLCGKGVCFDTGGYDLKPGSAMGKMKKDMGGAAIILGLARLVMTLDLPIRLHVRIGCVENSVSGRAMRPSDVIATHSGLMVEVGNTDAEGRLVLCDLLAEAAAESPDCLIDAATLTGAARVALGPDLPAVFCNHEALAEAILSAGNIAQDPLWRLPLWSGYNSWLDSPIANVNNISSKPFAGAILGALFLQRFVPASVPWAHLDLYAWNDETRPGRPQGGEAQTLRALFAALEGISKRNPFR